MAPLPNSHAEEIVITQTPPIQVSLANARRRLEIAKIELRLYEEIEYPRKERHFDAQIKFLSLDIEGLKKRVREYKRFNNSRSTSPFLVSLHEAKLALLDAEFRLKDARAERCSLRKFHPDRRKLFLLRIEAARAEVIALDRLLHGE